MRAGWRRRWWAIGRRMDKKVQALITDMNQPLGFAIGNALEIMEASQTLQNAGPAGPDQALARTGRAHDLPGQEGRHARRGAPHGREAPGGRLRHTSKFKQVVAAQGGNAQALDKFELLPNATGMREITSPRAGYVSVDRRRGHRRGVQHDRRRPRHEGRRDRSRRGHHPRSQGRREGGRRLACSAASITPRKTAWKKPPSMVEDAFRISGAEARRARADSGSRRRLDGPVHGAAGTRRHPGGRVAVLHPQARDQAAHHRLGHGPAVRFRGAGAEDRFRQSLPGDRRGRQRDARTTPRRAASSCSATAGHQGAGRSA